MVLTPENVGLILACLAGATWCALDNWVSVLFRNKEGDALLTRLKRSQTSGVVDGGAGHNG
jgi:hypothetical protein